MSKTQTQAPPVYALLELVASHIERHPEEFNMGNWECGTTACIAGHMARFCGKKLRTTKGEPLSSNDALKAADDLAESIGLPKIKVDELGGSGHPLFFWRDWPGEFRNQYDEACLASNPSQAKANAAAARIRHYIASEGRE